MEKSVLPSSNNEGSNHAHLFCFSGANKAGMDGIDKVLQSNIIYEMSKNSAFFKNAKQKDAKTDQKIMTIKESIAQLNNNKGRFDLLKEKSFRDLAAAEEQRTLHRVCCVLDMDMFFAAVEIRDNPTLKDQPMAVGGLDMICTANYIARKFGVRSAMPGFIAKRLCPELIFVPVNFNKYTAVSETIKSVIREYDASFRSFSLDEMYMDLTNACSARAASDTHNRPEMGVNFVTLQHIAEEIVTEIRTKIQVETGGLTASAGIAPNFLLAKIAADMKKPDGQFVTPATPTDINCFMASLPVRKVPGIGKVTERILTSLDINTVGDIRGFLPYILHTFSTIQYNYLLHISLGIDRDEGQQQQQQQSSVSHSPEKDDGRKSLGASRTFPPTAAKSVLLEKLKLVCDIVGSEMVAKDLHAKTVTLKLKSSTYEESSRRRTVRKSLQSADEIYHISLSVLAEFWSSNTSVRLVGVTMSNFENIIMVRHALDAFFKSNRTLQQDYMSAEGNSSSLASDQRLLLSEKEEEVSREDDVSCNLEPNNSIEVDESVRDSFYEMKTETKEGLVLCSDERDELVTCDCPVCGASLSGTAVAANIHVDKCLSRNIPSEKRGGGNVPVNGHCDRHGRKKRLSQSDVGRFFKRPNHPYGNGFPL
eukprot:gene10692-22326_t